MAYLNENYLKLQAGYLFPEIARRVREFCEKNPEAAKRLIRCGIGDVTEPLPQAAIDAMKRAMDELGNRETFRGYGPEQGYDFVRSTIAQKDFRDRKIEISESGFRDVEKKVSGDGSMVGTCQGIDENGAVVLSNQKGEHHFSTGEITCFWP